MHDERLNKPLIQNNYAQFVLFNILFLALQLFYMFTMSIGLLDAIPLPRSARLVIYGEGLLQLALYLLLAAIQTSWLWGIHALLKKKQIRIQLPFIRLFIFIISASLILSLNSYLFPSSRFAHLMSYLFSSTTTICVIILLSMLCLGLTINSLRSFYLAHQKATVTFIIMTLGTLVLTSLLPFLHNTPPMDDQSASTQHPHAPPHPNIILIGIDSLNPTLINAHDTPTLNQLTQDSVQFTETISPLARTFPAWLSILSGLYPIHHHARENLTPLELVKNEASIVWKLRELGYQTLFASDDRRFNNIDEAFGFHYTIGPKVGINDFILGGFYDFPLSNLLINQRISQWLLPYNYMNRASQYSYNPDTFDHELERGLAQLPPNHPLFLAIHFTLPHWPYTWAASPYSEIQFQVNTTNRNSLYRIAVRRVDQQIAALIDELKHRGVLSNSLLVLLSDHGEALYEKGSRITTLKQYQGTLPSPLAKYFKRHTSTPLQKSAGHGSDLLSPEQFNCLLSFQIFKENQSIIPPRKIASRVSLIDIAPTIFSFLNLPQLLEKRHFDGLSLMPVLTGEIAQPPERPFLLESGLFPNQILSAKKALYYANLFYEVNPDNDRLVLRKEKLNRINAMKLYGIIDKEWLLVLYPTKKHYLPVIVQLKTHEWSDQADSKFAQQSPETKLLTQLKRFYPQELSQYPLRQSVPRL